MKDYAKSAAFPITLSALLVSMTMNIYNNSEIVPFTVLAFFLQIALFFLFRLLSKRKILGGLVYTAILLGFLFGLMSYLFANWYKAPIPFSSWFYAAQDETTAFMPFSIVLFAGLSFFLASVIFYYTQIIYRSVAVLLCSLIPFAIYAKRYETPKIIYIALVLIVFLALMVHQKQLVSKDHIVMTDGSYWISVSLFVGVVIGLAIIIPKPEITPLRNAFDEMIEKMEGVSVDSDRIVGKLETETTGNDFFENPTGKMYYYVLSDDAPLYLKSQVYDEYSGKRRWKVARQYYESGYNDWPENNVYLHYDMLTDAIRDYAETYGIGAKYNVPDVKSSKKTAEIYAADFPSQYALTANGIYGLTEIDNEERTSFMNPHGDIFWTSAYMPPNDKYKISYTSENKDMFSGAIEFSRQFDRESFKKLLEEMVSYEDYDGYSDLIAEAFLEELYAAENYHKDTKGDISEEIQTLADEITKGCNSDVEKALAIQNYFLDGSFRYQMGYRASGNDIETFIFKDKTGICVDYATAVVLLARASDLPARYTVGFLMTEPMTEGYYAVRDKHGHAWAEIYISGYGWMTFDATPAGNDTDEGITETPQDIDPMKTLWVTFILVALGVVAAILIIVFMPFIKEGIFRIIFSVSTGEKKIVRLYKKTSKIIGRKSGEKTEAFSTVELSDLAKEKFSFDISPITRLTEKVCYGKRKADHTEIKQSFDCYKEFYKVLRKKK